MPKTNDAKRVTRNLTRQLTRNVRQAEKERVDVTDILEAMGEWNEVLKRRLADATGEPVETFGCPIWDELCEEPDPDPPDGP